VDDDRPFPIEAARDLLGIVRALWRAKKAAGGGYAELEAYVKIGRKLARAIEISQERKLTSAQSARVLANEAVIDLGNILEPKPIYVRDLLLAAKGAIEAGPRRRRR
jgi:hypothetical protein